MRMSLTTFVYFRQDEILMRSQPFHIDNIILNHIIGSVKHGVNSKDQKL